jgi:hypothetical protein
VRARYTAPDAFASGAWTAAAAEGTYVLLEVQSALPGIVQVRLDLWLVHDSTATLVGRSDPFAAAAEVGAVVFEDLTGDGLPDLVGWVGDSAGTRYPVVVPAARGAMADALDVAAPGWRFDVEDSLPRVLPGPGARPCALALWAEAPTRDGTAPGWRFLRIERGGGLGAPTSQAPRCGPGPG